MLSGALLTIEVEWEVELAADGQRHVVCHCGACQLLSGGAVSITSAPHARSPAADIDTPSSPSTRSPPSPPSRSPRARRALRSTRTVSNLPAQTLQKSGSFSVTNWERDIIKQSLTAAGCFHYLSSRPVKNLFRIITDRTSPPSSEGDSGNEVDCFFCSNCTSSPYHHQKVLGDKIVIRTSLLQGTHAWDKPALEIYEKEKFSWQPRTGDAGVPAGPE
jgi:hypothetical protein